MSKCPHCQSCIGQNKAGLTRFGSARFFCRACGRAYTPNPKVHGYDSAIRQEAVRYSLEGLSQRKVARLLRVSPQSVANWLEAAGQKLDASGVPLVPPELAQLCGEIMEQDELYTFCTAKAPGKNPALKADSNADSNADSASHADSNADSASHADSNADSASHAQKKSAILKTTNQDGST